MSKIGQWVAEDMANHPENYPDTGGPEPEMKGDENESE